MSRIVQAVNAMIANQDKIRNVIRRHGEIFFQYGDKHIWSMVDDGTSFRLFYYPGADTVDNIALLGTFSDVPMVSYNSDDIGTREGLNSFRELWTILEEKVFGMDSVLDEIIGQLFEQG